MATKKKRHSAVFVTGIQSQQQRNKLDGDATVASGTHYKEMTKKVMRSTIHIYYTWESIAVLSLV